MGHSVWWKVWFKRSINELTAHDDLQPKLISLLNSWKCLSITLKPVLHASGNRCWSPMQTFLFVCTRKFESQRISGHICMHIHLQICMHICKPTSYISASYLYHILKGIKHISVLNDWHFWIMSCFLIQDVVKITFISWSGYFVKQFISQSA